MNRRALCGAVLALLAGFAFGPAFSDPGYTWVLTGAVATVTVVCLVLRAGSAAPIYRVASAALALGGYVWLAVAPGLAVFEGPKRLLTTALPVEPAGPELAAVTVVIGLAALAAVEPALRGKSSVWQAIGPLLATGLGCAVAASAGAPPVWLAPALACGIALLLLLERYAPTGLPSPYRTVGGLAGALRVVTSVLTLILLAGVGLAGWHGPTLAGGAQRNRPADARELIDQAVLPKTATSPLAMFSALRNGRRELSLSVTAAGHEPVLMRYASLDRFDGTSWTTGAVFRRAGRWLPGDPAVPHQMVEEQVVVLAADAMGWLVSSGRAVEVSVAGLGVNEASGDVVVPADVAVPQRYTVRSAVHIGRAEGAIAAAGDPAWRAPPGFAEWARQITGPERDDAALRRLEQHFTADYTLDTTPSAPSGHGVFAINRLRQARSGTAEQFASAFAVLARALGYDVRVVVGFRAQRVGAHEYSVTGKDVHAWAEVRYEGAGWVRYDPTPTRVASGGPEDEEDDGDGENTPPSQAPQPPASFPASEGGSGAQAEAARSRNLWPIIAAALVIALYLVGVPAAKAARRFRRRAGRQRAVVNAWRETVDRLAEARVPILAGDTALQIADATGRSLGDGVAGPVRELALLHNEAVFSAAGAPQAGRAWQIAGAVREALRRTAGPARRLARLLDPRPLLPRNW